MLSLVLDWHACSVDFSGASIQAALWKSAWLCTPCGFQSKRDGKTIFRLNKSICGLAGAPKLWWEHLFKALKEGGFVVSKFDPCLLFKKDAVLVPCINNVGISASKLKQDVDEKVERLRKKGLELTRKGTFSEFLGIKFEKNPDDGSINVTQKGLISKIIETAAGRTNCNQSWNPASTAPLGTDPDGEPNNEPWNCRLAIGMVLRLTTNTHPDCAPTVSQAARFSHDPKQLHAAVVKTIIRHLKRTHDKGTIVRPTGVLSLENCVDTSFAGNCGANLLKVPPAIASTICCCVCKDNASALLLANSQHLNNQNKCLAAKLHHFWSHVKPGIIWVVKCDTKLMLADAFAKPLVREVFNRLWLLLSWDGNPSAHVVRCGSKRKSAGRLTRTCLLVSLPLASTAKVKKTVVALKFDVASNEKESWNLSRLS